jgi:hypothetical protein
MVSPPHLGPVRCEEEWLRSADPAPMIEFLGERGSWRRWLLFACACCWRILPLLTDERSRHAVSVAERLAEGAFDPREEAAAREEANLAVVQAYQSVDLALALASMAAASALAAPRRAWRHAAEATSSGAGAERAAQCDLLRELFGNPFRPSAFDPAWRTPIVTAIASQIYQREAWEEMPVLGDALEDAGCPDAAALTHCRAGGPHLRGCWVVDGILGKN